MKNLFKKSIISFVIGFVFFCSTVVVMAGSAQGTIYSWAVGNATFYNYSAVETNKTLVVGAGGIGSTVSEPAGYLGVQAVVYDGSYNIVKTGAWGYNSSTQSANRYHIENAMINKPNTGNYMAQATTKYYRNSAYNTVYAYSSPYQGFPG